MVGLPRFTRYRMAIVLLLLALSRLSDIRVVSGYDSHEANASVQSADESVSSAFEAVLQAEKAGANVSKLVARLNEAVRIILEAKVMLGKGNFNDVVELTSWAVAIARNVSSEVSILDVSVLSQRDLVFKVSLVGSSVGVASFLAFMYVSWRWFKNYYTRRVSSSRPEVVKNLDA